MSDNIYKVFIYDKDQNNYNIFVFVGIMELSKLQKIEQDFKYNPKENQFIDIIFSENDYKYMNNDFSNVKFINESIYNSNTWEEISYKISKINDMYSYQELYLYGETRVDFDYDNIIDYLTHEGYISKERLLYFLDNCNVDKDFEESIIENDKTLFEYFDLINMKLLEHIKSVKQPLGIQFKSNKRFQYFHNPHNYQTDVFHYTNEFTPNLPLFHYLLSSTNIFCVPFHASFTNTTKKIVELYFPLLKDENISSETFTSIRKKLKQENEKLQSIFHSKDIIHYYFHSSYGSKEPKIENVKLILIPEKKMYISLETLFKILPTNGEKRLFLTKYNPGMKEEKLFKIATNQYKEPILRRVYLQKIQTEMASAKKRYVGIYCEYQLNKYIFPMIIEIYETGHVQISLNNEKLLDDKRFDNKGNKIELQDFENILKENYNSIIEYINQYFDHSGVTLPLFHTFFSRSVIVDNMKLFYKETIQDDSRIMKNLIQLDNALSSYFQIIEQTKQYTKFYMIPTFRLKNPKKMIVTFELIDTKKRVYDLKVENISNIGMIEYLQYFLFSLLKIAESPNKFIDQIQSGTIIMPKKEALEVVTEEKVSEETDEGFILEDDKNEVEDLFDKQSQRSRASSFTSEKGFEFDNEDDDDDDFFDNSDNNSEGSFLGGERNLMQKRMEERDPYLFKSDKKEGLVYSRFCPSSAQRQPVSLTEDEMKNADKNTFTKALHYGSDQEHMNYYICPRYWCEEKNIPLSQDDVKMENGKLISEKCRKMDNSYAEIIEFNNSKVHRNKEGDYEHTYPSVSKKSCIPCCFKKQQKNVINSRCMANDEEKDSSDASKEEKLKSEGKDEEKKTKTDEKNIKQKYNYIQQHNKFPLEPQKWGYLPLNIQAMLDNEGVKCKENFCMLRFGVKKDNNSFLSALGSALYIEQNEKELKLGNIPQFDVKQVREILLDAIDLDRFVSLQNGNLIQIFGKSIEEQKISEKNKKSVIYQNLHKVNKPLFNLIVDAYNNFKVFIKKSVSLDYFYLYDLICEPNEKLFKDGINIVILETENMDITNNFNFICPTNFYKTSAFERSRRTILFMKHGNYYEPIYSNSSQNDIIHSFKFYNRILNTLLVKFESLQNDREKYCGVRSFDEMKYVYKENTLEYVINILNKYGFQISNQVIYYNGRISGITCKYIYKDDYHETYIPCKLSNIVNYLPSIYISECEFHDFNTTYNNLNYIFNVTRNKIPCKPIEQIVEKNIVFGIKTIGNLLVPLKLPQQIINKELAHSENNYFVPYQNNMIHIDEMVYHKINEKTEMSPELESLYSNSRQYEIFKTELRSFLHKDKYKHISYEFKSILLDYKLDEKEKIVRLKELFDKVYVYENIKYNENFMMKLISEIITNYRVQHYISVDDQYLFMNNHRSKKNEILITQKMLGDKDVYNDNELYKYVEYKENAYDYVLPVSKTLYDINEHIENIEKFERVSPLKKMSLKINKSQYEVISEPIKEVEAEPVKPVRCSKGLKWSKKLKKCVPK